MKFGDFAAFVKYSWLFLARKNDRDLLTEEAVMIGTRKHTDPVWLDPVEQDELNSLGDYLAHKRSYEITIKELYAWMRW